MNNFKPPWVSLGIVVVIALEQGFSDSQIILWLGLLGMAALAGYQLYLERSKMELSATRRPATARVQKLPVHWLRTQRQQMEHLGCVIPFIRFQPTSPPKQKLCIKRPNVFDSLSATLCS